MEKSKIIERLTHEEILFLEAKGLERLRLLNPAFVLKEWYYQRPLRPEEIKKEPNLKEGQTIIWRSFDPSPVVGIIDDDRYSLNWMALLGSLPHFPQEGMITMKQAVCWIDSATIQIMCYDGIPFCYSKDLHSICLAKFLGLPLQKVQITFHQ